MYLVTVLHARQWIMVKADLTMLQYVDTLLDTAIHYSTVWITVEEKKIYHVLCQNEVNNSGVVLELKFENNSRSVNFVLTHNMIYCQSSHNIQRWRAIGRLNDERNFTVSSFKFPQLL